MQTNSPVPAQITWAVITEWHRTTARREGHHIVNTFIEEAKPHGISWLLAYLWAGVRTQWFTAPCVDQHGDYGNLGGHYLTYRASIRDICTEFSKYSDTAMLQEEAVLLDELKALMDFALKVNPAGEKPPEPPRTVPVPLPPPEPEPSKPEEPAKPSEPAKPGKPFDWKKVLLPLAIVAIGALVKMFAPGWAGVLWDVIAGALGG